jgi:hypothetical protein
MFVVAAEQRGYTLFLLDRYLRQQNADLMISNTANGQSFRVFSQLGVSLAPAETWNRTALWVTNHRGLVADWLKRRDFVASTALSYPAALLLSIRDAWFRMLVNVRSSRGLSSEFCTAFDERFDTFWERLRECYKSKLLAVRNRATLGWHFQQALRENRVWILSLSRGQALIAYAVFVLSKAEEGDPILRMNLADFQSLDDDQNIYFVLLRSAIGLVQEHGIHLLSMIGVTASGIDATLFAPYRRPLSNCTFVFKARNPNLAATLADPRLWCPSLYDGDASL